LSDSNTKKKTISKNEKDEVAVISQQMGNITRPTKIKKLNRKIILKTKNDKKEKTKQKIKTCSIQKY
jgi:hypothetical protein